MQTNSRRGTLVTSGLTGAMAIAGGTSAYAAVTPVSTPTNMSIVAGTAQVNQNWDVDGDAVVDFVFSYRYHNVASGNGVIWQAQMNPAAGLNGSNNPLGYQGTFVRYAEAFGLGTVFGPVPPVNVPAVSFGTAATVILGSRYRLSDVPAYYGGFATGAPPPGTNGFAGFRFNIGGQTHYGFVELSVGPGFINFVSAAYESTANTAIATAIPEPGSLAALAFGAAAVLKRRRRSA